MSLDDTPQLLKKYSQLRDIGKRVNTEQPQAPFLRWAKYRVALIKPN